LVTVSVVAVFGVASPMVVSTWMARAERDRIYTELEQVPARKVALVLGARVWRSGEPSTSLADRLHAALELYEAGKVEKILVTGDHGLHGYNEVRAMFTWLVERGVPKDKIFTDHAGFRTLDSMERAVKVFGVEDAIICTQEFHLPRSLFLARVSGLDAVGYVADRRVYEVRYKNAVREAGARTKALLDVHVLGTQPKFLGERIPIDGPASASWDDTIVVSRTGKRRGG
jgi:SanA protein